MEIRKGDRITALGCTFEVDVILYQEHYDPEGYDIEFKDPNGVYHHWVQWADGGELQRRM